MFTMMMVMTMIVSDEGGGIISISIVVIASAAMAANAIISVAAAMARGWTNRCDAATASLREKTARALGPSSQPFWWHVRGHGFHGSVVAVVDRATNSWLLVCASCGH